MRNYQFNVRGLKNIFRSKGFAISGAICSVALGGLAILSSFAEPEELSDIKPEYGVSINGSFCSNIARTLNESFDLAVNNDGEVINAAMIDELVGVAADYRSGVAQATHCRFPNLDQKLKIINLYGSEECQDAAKALDALFVTAKKLRDAQMLEEISVMVTDYKQGNGPKAPGDQCSFPSLDKRIAQYGMK